MCIHLPVLTPFVSTPRHLKIILSDLTNRTAKLFYYTEGHWGQHYLSWSINAGFFQSVSVNLCIRTTNKIKHSNGNTG